MMNGGPSGFYNTPVSRGVVVASAVFSVLFGMQRRSNKLGLSYQVQFVSPSNFLALGPYGLIYPSFIPFYFDIPVSTHFRVLGIKFSDKSLVYLRGLQLLLSSWRRTVLPGICGIVVGFLYRMNVFGIRKAKLVFPASVSLFFSRLLWLSSTSPPTSSSRSVFRNFPSTTAQLRNYTSVPSMVEPSEEYTATLVSMGFNRDTAIQALVQARNDINAATSILLEAQSQYWLEKQVWHITEPQQKHHTG